MSELKPCPFCGAPDMDADENADVRKCVDRSGWLDGKGNRGPECLSCGATALSVEAWNSRAIIDPPAQGEAEQPRFGCHVDLEPGAKPDDCVIDLGDFDNCTRASKLLREGRADKKNCEYWKIIATDKQPACEAVSVPSKWDFFESTIGPTILKHIVHADELAVRRIWDDVRRAFLLDGREG